MYSNSHNVFSPHFNGRIDEAGSKAPVISKTLFVVIDDETLSERFPIDFNLSKTVGHLKQPTKEANPTSLSDIDVRKLKA